MADDGILGMLADRSTAAVTAAAEAREIASIGGGNLPPSLQIMLDDRLYERVKNLASLMANDTAFTPRHLRGKAAACFTVLNQALDWKLSPQFVARNTYETPGGAIGFMGALVQAILEQSGRFIGAPSFEHTGDWSKVIGKFEIGKSQKGNDFVKRTWTTKDAEGLGVRVRWQIRGEPAPRCWPSEKNPPFMLTQCFPLNSPLWSTDPMTQIAYLAIRRFANQAAPGLLGGMPFDHEEFLDASELARDVTPPRPKREDFGAIPAEVRRDPPPPSEPLFAVVDCDGVETEHDGYEATIAALTEIFDDGARRGMSSLTGAAESNRGTLDALNEAGQADELRAAYGAHLEALKQPSRAEPAERPGAVAGADPHPAESLPGAGAEPEGKTAGKAAQGAPDATAEPARGRTGGSIPPTRADTQPSRANVPAGSPTPAVHSAGHGGEDRPHAGENPSPSPASAVAYTAAPPAAEGELALASVPAAAPRAVAPPQRPSRADWYDRESLRLEPTRAGGRANWSSWYAAQLLPRLKGAQNTGDLAHLLGDNADLVEQYQRDAGANEATALNAAIDRQWAHVAAWEAG